MTPSAALARARLIALLTPALLLGGALGSQYVGGLYPCEMCMWQRWPHLVAIFFALDAYALKARPPIALLFTVFAALAIGVSGAIGVFHAGVEYGWWQGLTECAASGSGGTTQDMLNSILNTPLIRCDVPQWTLWGISLAGFNALFSLGAAGAVAALVLRMKRAGS
ncbi:MAG: disulfide bond formation protein B [Sphingobium sp.]|nr:disulfide bond formation protein B [Sphingobium sp.]MBP6110938.1 disulfide bond formation protein B [Sphingobium sp.]MBP8670636.1 disulfide bond formation protein B [Sphingobium sp.]MBP9156990.1 disulfide bond formation protein B [Sphingobium sp.]MCC6481696.1 disulfide bond formation protein B [Sphingomonadaceae bacterium]